MCSPPCIDQTTSHTPFDFTVDASLKTGRKCANTSLAMQKTQVKKDISNRKVLALYEDYLKKRVKETWPSARIGNRLFEEIKAKGYRGSFQTMKKFLCRFRKEGEFPKEKSLSYYKGYIKKSLGKNQPHCVPTRKLFNEIKAKGYQGSLSAVKQFLWVIRKEAKAPKEASIQFHKEYLIKRVKETYPEHVSGTELFEEIRTKGYQGQLNTLQTFLSTLRKKAKRPSEVSLDFHKGYLIKRIKDASPECVSATDLFEEIKAKGYRGSASTLRVFLSMLRKREKKPIDELSNASVEFHRDYLIKRSEETYPSYVSGTKLFKEIRAKGYRGSLSTLQRFLLMLRKQEKKPSEAYVEFHEEYLIKRLEET